MAKDLYNRYIWLVDTIRRYGRITRHELDECWMRSKFSNGEKLPRRTFYNYRNAVEELFSIDIRCDSSTFEYYIENDGDAHNEGMTNWLLNSAAINDVLSEARNVADRIFIEDVPSAREFLAPVIEALREHHPIRFDYHPYTRTKATTGVVLEPYFLKIFRQRWYVTGLNPADGKIKTYALDRMLSLTLLPETFDGDAAFDPEEYFRHSFGIVFTQGEVKRVAIRTDTRQAKYFRALPLHSSQEEVVHDDYSIFYYKLRISPDFVEEILSHGPRVTVLEPPELRAMVVTELKAALDNYEPASAPDSRARMARE